MTPDKSSSLAGSDDGQFDKTRWSMVLGAVQRRAPCAQKALAEFCGLYWRPLYAFARRRGRSPEDAQDLVRRFFAHLIGSRVQAGISHVPVRNAHRVPTSVGVSRESIRPGRPLPRRPEKVRLATVERSTGRFRSFLLAFFQSFITAENRRARAETVKIIPRPPKSFFEGIGQFSSLNSLRTDG